MIVKQRRPIRNLLDLKDGGQVRLLKKRLGLSETQLRAVVEKVGNGIVAVAKEAQSSKLPDREL